MAAVSGEIPGFYNGISQQPAILRLPTQMEDCLNVDATLVHGLRRRPPTQHVAQITQYHMGTKQGRSVLVNHGNGVRYFLTTADNHFSAVSLEGGALPVRDKDGKGDSLEGYRSFPYLTGGVDVRIRAAGDHVFVLNRTKTTTYDKQQKFPVRDPEALINVAQGNFSRTYSITVHGKKAEYLTPGGGLAGSANCASTENIAQILINGTMAVGGGNFFNGIGPNGTENRPIWGNSEDNHQIIDNAGIIYTHLHGQGIRYEDYFPGKTHDDALGKHLSQGIVGERVLRSYYDGAGLASYVSYGGTLSFLDWIQAGFPLAPNDPRRNSTYTVYGWLVRRYGSSIWITWQNQRDFTIQGSDGYNGHAMKVCKDRVQDISDLGQYAPPGFTIEVSGQPGNDKDSYWVRAAHAANFSDDRGIVIWKETVKPGALKGLSSAKDMPMLLAKHPSELRMTDVQWDGRGCGDEIISPDPSFVDRNLSDIFLFNNRLGFLSDESVVLSRSGDYFNFYRTTATAYLDDDPIDIAVSTDAINKLHHAVQADNGLVLFSENSQFLLTGSPTLTPKSVSLTRLSDFPSSASVAPVTAGGKIFFAQTDGGNAQLYEYFFDPSTETGDAACITSHVPYLIPGDVQWMVASSEEKMLVAYCASTPRRLYVYRHEQVGREQVQSAWFKWDMTTSCTNIWGAGFSGDRLYLVINRQGRLCLEYMDVAYDIGRMPDGLVRSRDKCLDRSSYAGQEGEEYESRATLSTLYLRDSERGGASASAQVGGRLQLQHIQFSFRDAGAFSLDSYNPVSNAFNTQQHDAFPPPVYGDRRFPQRLSLPVMARNDRATIQIRNVGWKPFNIHSAFWRGQWSKNNLQN